MAGEDLTTLLDEDDLPAAALLHDGDRQPRRRRRQKLAADRPHRRGPLAPLRDRGRGRAERDRRGDGRLADGARRSSSATALAMAGGTLPEFGDDAGAPPAAHRATKTRRSPTTARSTPTSRRRTSCDEPPSDAEAKAPKERRNPPTEWLYAHRNRIFGVMMIGWFMALMDVSIVNITIPELRARLRDQPDDRLVGRERLQHRLRRAADHGRPPRRPVRPQEVLHPRPDDLHDRARRCARSRGRSAG